MPEPLFGMQREGVYLCQGRIDIGTYSLSGFTLR